MGWKGRVVQGLVTAGVLVSTYGVPSASAGVYFANACDATVGLTNVGAWQRWPPAPNPQAPGSWGNGLHSNRCTATGAGLEISTGWNSHVPFGATGNWMFEAPDGAFIAGFSAAVRRWGSLADSLRPEVWIPGTGTTLLGDSTFGSVGYDRVRVGYAPMSTKHIAFGYRCKLTLGCAPSGGTGVVMADEITVSISDESPPTIVPRQPAPERWVSGGVVPLEFAAHDNVGIRQLSIAVNGDVKAVSETPCYSPANNFERTPCAAANQRVAARIPVSELSEGEHSVVAAARDVGDSTTVEQARLRIDRTAPTAPRRLSVSRGDQWRGESRIAISWVNPPEQHAPITGAEYEFCPAANSPYDGQGCVRVGGAEAESDTVAVPGDGEWSLRVALRDAAGNSDPRNAASIEPVRVDTVPPLGSLQAFDPLDPLRIQLTANDALSGIDAVEVEIRREGEATWRSLAIEGGDGRYSAIADDAVLPPGNYTVRARVTDRAGNDRTITTLQDGTPLRIGLPVRSGTAMLVGRAARKRVKSARGKRPRYEQVLLERPTADFGSSVALTGKLSDAAGNPRGNAVIEVLERVNLVGRDWIHVATVRSGANGAFTYRAKPGPARLVRFAYPGTALAQPGAKDVELRVRAAVSIRPDRRQARNGGAVTFTGRLRSGPVPENGKVLALQALTQRGWRTFATPRARAGDGRWRFWYRFTGTSVRSRYSFRVVALSEAGYPYAQGHSPTTHVVVHP